MIEFKRVQYILDSVSKEIARASLEYVDKDRTYSVLTALNRLGYLQWPPNKVNRPDTSKCTCEVGTNFPCKFCIDKLHEL